MCIKIINKLNFYQLLCLGFDLLSISEKLEINILIAVPAEQFIIFNLYTIPHTDMTQQKLPTFWTYTLVLPNATLLACSSVDTWVTATLYDVLTTERTFISLRTATGLVPTCSSVLTWRNDWTFWVLSLNIPFLAVCAFEPSIADFLTSVIVTCVMSSVT